MRHGFREERGASIQMLESEEDQLLPGFGSGVPRPPDRETPFHLKYPNVDQPFFFFLNNLFVDSRSPSLRFFGSRVPWKFRCALFIFFFTDPFPKPSCDSQLFPEVFVRAEV